ncbi:hypothetical protein BJ085DRAFT_15979, partial [Dimargaris cristalligena]
EHIAVSFNGGKDCTILLELVSVIAAHRRPTSASPLKLIASYVTHPDGFPEVDQFVDEAVQRYNLDLVKTAGPLKQGLTEFMQLRPHIQAMVVGTRRTDPHGATMHHFEPTNGDWPRFMRVNPVINWSYTEVWTFLKQLHVPYCSLYDKGFTSLGETRSTKPNHALANPSLLCGYNPAWTLTDCSRERYGRSTPVTSGEIKSFNGSSRNVPPQSQQK